MTISDTIRDINRYRHDNGRRYTIVGPAQGLGDQGRSLNTGKKTASIMLEQPVADVHYLHEEHTPLGQVVAYSYEAPSNAVWAVCVVDAVPYEIEGIRYLSAAASGIALADHPGESHLELIDELSIVRTTANHKAPIRVYPMDVVADTPTSWPTDDANGDRMPPRVREILTDARAGYRPDVTSLTIAGLPDALAGLPDMPAPPPVEEAESDAAPSMPPPPRPQPTSQELAENQVRLGIVAKELRGEPPYSVG